MRTIVGISGRQRSILLSLAARRGLKGYSTLIQEAPDRYIADEIGELEVKERVLAMKGNRQQEETEQTRSRLLELRQRWNVS